MLNIYIITRIYYIITGIYFFLFSVLALNVKDFAQNDLDCQIKYLKNKKNNAIRYILRLSCRRQLY